MMIMCHSGHLVRPMEQTLCSIRDLALREYPKDERPVGMFSGSIERLDLNEMFCAKRTFFHLKQLYNNPKKPTQ